MGEGGAASLGLLQGIRVLELGDGLAGAITGMLLAEQGADVVRFACDTEADPMLTAMLARGKTEVSCSDPASGGSASDRVGSGAARQELADLAERADIIIESYVPGTTPMPLAIDAARRANRGLISCRIPAFPATDSRAALPGFEAIAGMAGFLYTKPFGRPVYHDFPVGSLLAALFAANGIMAALIARLRTGRGQQVESSLYHGSLFAQVLQIFAMTGMPRAFLPLKMAGTPFMGVWECADGRFIYVHVTVPAHNARMRERLRASGYAEAVAALERTLSPATVADPSQVKSVGEARRIRAALRRIFLTKSADEWEALFGAELCCIKVRTVSEWTRDSRAAGMADTCTIEDPLFGRLEAPGRSVTVAHAQEPLLARARAGSLAAVKARWPVRASDADTGAEASADNSCDTGQAGSDTDADTDADVSAGAAASPAHAPSATPPLAGVRVLDLSRVIAGPCATRILAELGAEVLSVQSPTALDWALSFHLLFNAGKRSVTLDFKDDEGKRTLWRIIEQYRPHVVLQNYRSLELARSVGVDPEAVHRRYPEMVYTYLNAYGSEGGFSERPGFEQVVQAVTGIQAAYGGGGRPKLLPTPVLDIGSGLCGAFASLLGLYRQMRGGGGSFLSTHMTSMAVLLQVRSLAAAQRRALPAEVASATREMGQGAMLVRARDGYACVAGRWRELLPWLVQVGLVEASARAKASEEVLVAAAPGFRKRSIAQWQRRVHDAHLAHAIAIMPAPRLRRSVVDLPRFDASARPLLSKKPYPELKPLTFIRAPIELSETPTVEVVAPPVRGTHTREVLAGIGIDVPPGAGVIAYPGDKPFIVWLASFVRWGIYAWRSGSI